MGYVPFDDLGTDEQIKMLQKAVKTLISNFENHDHKADGSVMIGVYESGLDVEGVYESE